MALNVGELFATLTLRDGDFANRLTRARGQLDSAGQAATATGSAMTTGLSLPLAGIGGAALKLGGDFEASMNRVAAVSGASGAEMQKLENLAKEMGSTTQYSASEAAEALGFLSMAGFDASQSAEALPGVLNLAAAGATDLGSAADIASNILSGYGMEVSELGSVNDALSKTFTSTNTDLNMLGESFKYVGPVASSAGLEFNEVSAAIGMMGNAGIQGSEAGTALRGAIAALINPTGETADTLKKLGVSVTDSNGKLKPLVEIIGDLEKSGASTADMMKIFGVEAGPAMQALVSQGSGELKKLAGEIENSGGTAERIAETQMQGFNGKMNELKSALEGLAIAIAQSGLLEFATSLAERLAGLVSRMSQADSTTLRVAAAFGALVATVGPVLLVVGKLISIFGSSLAAIASFVRGTALFVAAAARMTAAAARVVAQVTVMAARVVAAGVRMAASAAATAARVVAGWVLMGAQALAQAARMAAAWVIAMGPVGWVIAAVVGLVALIVANWDRIRAATLAVWDWIWNKIKSVAGFLVDIFMNFSLPGLIIKHWDTIKSATTAAWNAVVNFVRAIPQRLVSFFLNWTLPGLLIKHWSSIRSATTRAWNAVINFVKSIPQRIVGFFLNWTLPGVIVKHWQSIRTGTVRTAGEMLAYVKGLPQRIVGFFSGFGRLLYDKGKDLIRGLLNGVKSMGSWLKNQLMSFAKNMIPGPIAKALKISSPSRVMRDQIGRHIPTGLVAGIKAGAPAVDRTMRQLVQLPTTAQPAYAGAAPAPTAHVSDRSRRAVHIEHWHAGSAGPDQTAAALAWRMKARG